ncbi:MAG: YSC84-related protein [Pseudoruegeria sp.]
MTRFTRRGFVIGASAITALTAGCGNGVGSTGSQEIDARVNATMNYLFTTYPDTQDLAAKATGILVMPLITEAGLWVGGSYGQGALQIDGVTVDYYSATQASVGFQIGAQQYAHVLFFMTDEALSNFRRSPGWAAGADIQYAALENAGNLSANTTTVSKPVVALIFGQAGLIAGASLKGTKYNRIIP